MHPKRNFDVTFRTINGQGYLLKQNLCFEINEVGIDIWQEIDGKKTVAEIATILAQKYNTAVADVHSDIEEFLMYLKEQQLIR